MSPLLSIFDILAYFRELANLGCAHTNRLHKLQICTDASRADWHAMQVRTPGKAAWRRSGIGSPQSSQYSALGPAGRRARAPDTAS